MHGHNALVIVVVMFKLLHLAEICTLQGSHSPVMIKFPDFSLTFPDILREHRRSIAPRNNSDIKNALIFSATLIYTDTSMTTTFPNILQQDNISMDTKV